MNPRYLKIIALLFFSCAREPVVGVVNGQPIYLWELEIRLKELRMRTADTNVLRTLFYQKLEELINREVIITSFPDITNSIPVEDVERAMFKDYSKEDVKKNLKSEGISYNEWFYTHRKDVLALLVLERLFKVEKEEENRVEVKDSEEEPSPYVEILHIVTNKREEAEKALELIKKGTPFEEVAKEFSISPEGKNGGRLGPFFPEEMPSEFDVCFTMKEGEVSDIIKSAYGYHLFKVLKKGKMERAERTKRELEEIKKTEKKEEFFKNLVLELKKKAEIKRKEISFESIRW